MSKNTVSKWEGNHLFFGTKDTGFSISPETVIIGTKPYQMWRVVWPDGVKSDDYYNKTRARDHARLEYQRSTLSEETSD